MVGTQQNIVLDHIIIRRLSLLTSCLVCIVIHSLLQANPKELIVGISRETPFVIDIHILYKIRCLNGWEKEKKNVMMITHSTAWVAHLMFISCRLLEWNFKLLLVYLSKTSCLYFLHGSIELFFIMKKLPVDI